MIILLKTKTISEKLVKYNHTPQIYATQLVSECQSPPEGNFSSWQTEYYFE